MFKLKYINIKIETDISRYLLFRKPLNQTKKSFCFVSKSLMDSSLQFQVLFDFYVLLDIFDILVYKFTVHIPK